MESDNRAYIVVRFEKDSGPDADFNVDKFKGFLTNDGDWSDSILDARIFRIFDLAQAKAYQYKDASVTDINIYTNWNPSWRLK